MPSATAEAPKGAKRPAVAAAAEPPFQKAKLGKKAKAVVNTNVFNFLQAVVVADELPATDAVPKAIHDIGPRSKVDLMVSCPALLPAHPAHAAWSTTAFGCVPLQALAAGVAYDSTGGTENHGVEVSVSSMSQHWGKLQIRFRSSGSSAHTASAAQHLV